MLGVLLLAASFLKGTVVGGARRTKPTGDGPPFQARPLLNRSERGLHDTVRGRLRDGHVVLPQVSYGEMVKNASFERYRTINTLRADLTVCDTDMRPVLVIEYHGKGHYGWTDAARRKVEDRDARKRVALSEAGIPLLELKYGYAVEDVDRALSSASVQPAGAGVPRRQPESGGGWGRSKGATAAPARTRK